jgi:hypothetical protein
MGHGAFPLSSRFLSLLTVLLLSLLPSAIEAQETSQKSKPQAFLYE